MSSTSNPSVLKIFPRRHWTACMLMEEVEKTESWVVPEQIFSSEVKVLTDYPGELVMTFFMASMERIPSQEARAMTC